MFQKIYDEIKYMLKLATAGSKEARQLEKVKHAFEQAFKSTEKSSAVGETKNSLDHKNQQSALDKNNEMLYNATKWATDNDVLNYGQVDDLYNKLSQIDSKLYSAEYMTTLNGEYMIPVSDIYDSALEGINNTVVYVKGKLDDFVVTQVVEFELDNETRLSNYREELYAIERFGISKKTAGVFRRYYPSDFRRNGFRYGSEGSRNANIDQFGTGRETSGGKAQNTDSYRTTKEGHKIYDLTPNEASSGDGAFSDGEKTNFSLSDQSLTQEQKTAFEEAKIVPPSDSIHYNLDAVESYREKLNKQFTIFF